MKFQEKKRNLRKLKATFPEISCVPLKHAILNLHAVLVLQA